ncbi:hypothetical protein LUZ60_001764 [Juncus effusus]|nr:hypothetical protein LUZ60_001764 [Juncus effusus]
MVQEGEESSWMANERVVYSSTKFFDQSGTTYFDELEEALIHGEPLKTIHDGPIKAYSEATRPPTLDIFPSWPIRHFHLAPEQSSSGESGSVKDTVSLSASAETETDEIGTDQRGRIMMAINGDCTTNNNTSSSSLRSTQPTIPTIDDVYNPSVPPGLDHKKKNAAGSTRKDGKLLDSKTLRRLAQNREAARKSRLRKKAYVQQLETSRIRLQQLEQDLQRARTQGLLLAGCGGTGDLSSGAAMFDMEYARWLEEEGRHTAELRAGLDAHLLDGNLGIIVDKCILHYDTHFRLKAALAQTDAFHLLTGLWTTLAERCFMWMGGFRPSYLIKIVMPHLDPLTDQQMMGLCSLQQSSQQAEEALSQGLDALHQSLSSTLSSGPLSLDMSHADVSNTYMSLMAVALDKISSLEGFIRQADNLRQQTLHQLRRILTTRQAARCFLAIGEYFRRLRTLSSVWATRPRENLIGSGSTSPSTTVTHELQPMPSQHNHYSGF